MASCGSRISDSTQEEWGHAVPQPGDDCLTVVPQRVLQLDEGISGNSVATTTNSHMQITPPTNARSIRWRPGTGPNKRETAPSQRAESAR